MEDRSPTNVKDNISNMFENVPNVALIEDGFTKVSEKETPF